MVTREWWRLCLHKSQGSPAVWKSTFPIRVAIFESPDFLLPRNSPSYTYGHLTLLTLEPSRECRGTGIQITSMLLIEIAAAGTQACRRQLGNVMQPD